MYISIISQHLAQLTGVANPLKIVDTKNNLSNTKENGRKLERLTALRPCSMHNGSSCLMSKTGTQHWVLSGNLAVQYSNNCWSTLYMRSYQS